MLLILSLIEDDQRRDRLAELYKLYKQPMMDIAADILHNGHDAEDAVHTVFLNIATKRISILDDLSDIQDLKYYLLASARNAAVNMLKANNRTVSLALWKLLILSACCVIIWNMRNWWKSLNQYRLLTGRHCITDIIWKCGLPGLHGY